MFDLQGKAVLEVNPKDEIEQIDVSNLPMGSYFLQIVTENGNVVTEKITKM